MIKQIKGTNFQKHTRIVIDLDKITTIVGPTDTGKSSIIRLIKWICTNKFSSNFESQAITWGKEFCRVEMDIDDFYIIREKGKSVNTYHLNEKEYKSFGNKIPEEIEKVINVDDNNFQLQIDDPYWFLKTSGEVSKELNRIVNLDKIDSSLYNINSSIRETNTEIKLNTERFNLSKEKVQNLSWIEDCNSKLQIVNQKKNELETISNSLSKLNQILLQVKQATNIIKLYKEIKLHYETLVSKEKQYQELNSKISKLEKLLSSIEENKETWQTIQQLSSKKEKEMEKKLVGLCPICGKEINQKK